MISSHSTVGGRRKAIVFAYACDPQTGSEPAAGWGIVNALSQAADCVVLVGPEHVKALGQWQAAHPENTTTFVAVPEPRWAQLVPRTRVTRFLIYLGCLRIAPQPPAPLPPAPFPFPRPPTL